MSLILMAKLLQRYFILFCLGIVISSAGLTGYGQATVEPEREQLLNGLKVLLWPRRLDENVLIILRTHSGAAFDVAGKAGEMAILADLLFPDSATRDYFTQEIEGRLDVDTDYDSITITLQGRATEFERITGILRTALISTQISPENVNRIRESRIKIAKETNISPAVLADRAIAARLFGDFPYGRPSAGTAETLARVERGDLLLAQERFLNPNNSTLVIIGDLPKSRVMRAVRQLLGQWRKSEKLVPSTFRQPDPPDMRTLIINAPADQSAELRIAVRGVARSHRDFAAANILAIAARRRWEKLGPELSNAPIFVRNEPHILPGMFVMGASVDNLLVAQTLKSAREVLKSLGAAPVSAVELEQARGEAVAQFTKTLERPEGLAGAWLDIDTFGLTSINEQMQSFSTVSPNDLQRLASSLFQESQIASVVIGDSKQLKTALEPTVKIELMGEVGNPSSSPPETKPATTHPAKKPD